MDDQDERMKNKKYKSLKMFPSKIILKFKNIVKFNQNKLLKLNIHATICIYRKGYIVTSTVSLTLIISKVLRLFSTGLDGLDRSSILLDTGEVSLQSLQYLESKGLFGSRSRRHSEHDTPHSEHSTHKK